jgi:riboflavin kinase
MSCVDTYYVVKGRVIDGIGEGAKYVKLYHHVLKNILGVSPYPGTLNILLDSSEVQKLKDLLQKHSCKYFIPPPCESCAHAYAWKAYLKVYERCFTVYIVKPAKTVHSDNIVELLSEVYLRKTFSLKTGDEVEICITLDCEKPCNCS